MPLKRFSHALIVIGFLLCTVYAWGGEIPMPPTVSLDRITPDDARIHLGMLAADSMQGRNTPSPQLEIAAEYIAARFKEYGLQPVNGSYKHPYTVIKMNLGTANKFLLWHESMSKSDTLLYEGKNMSATTMGTVGFGAPMEIKTDYVPYDFTAGTSDSGAVVFAGYGITAPEYHWDDYANIDVKGKFVLVLRHEPDEKGTDTSFFRGKKWTRYSEVRGKMKNAAEHGAIGIIVVNDPANHMLLKPEGYPWPSLFFKYMRDEDLPITLAGNQAKRILAVHAGERLMGALFGSVDSLIKIQKQIDSTRTPRSFAISGVTVSMAIALEEHEMHVPNVTGWYQGTDADSEHIVIGAHFDHVGTMRAETEKSDKSDPSDSSAHAPHNRSQRTDGPTTDTIFNGADDNASGTTGILEVARAFSAAPVKPKRSVLFIAFSGEEKGLYGSRAYADKPEVSLAKCAAMLNMDMIGRNAPDSVELGGGTTSPELAQIALDENKSIGMLVKQSDDFTGRSDQASFMAKKIPVLFFFTGEHEDYHKVGDSVDKINFEKLSRIAKWCFRTAWVVAEGETKLAFKEK